MPEIKFAKESYKVMGACFEVYNQMGPGFLEAVYHECLGLEFSARGIPFVSRPPLDIHYAGVKLLTGYAPDFVCYDRIILEIKAAIGLREEHRAQTLNYLKATGLDLALLVNFGAFPKLESQRLIANEEKWQVEAPA